MQLNGDGDYAGWSTLDEHAWMAQSLPWEQADVLELGCGDGARARHFATALPLRQITAAEVDEVAHHDGVVNGVIGVEGWIGEEFLGALPNDEVLGVVFVDESGFDAIVDVVG